MKGKGKVKEEGKGCDVTRGEEGVGLGGRNGNEVEKYWGSKEKLRLRGETRWEEKGRGWDAGKVCAVVVVVM